jgi:hypothetical protein
VKKKRVRVREVRRCARDSEDKTDKVTTRVKKKVVTRVKKRVVTRVKQVDEKKSEEGGFHHFV